MEKPILEWHELVTNLVVRSLLLKNPSQDPPGHALTSGALTGSTTSAITALEEAAARCPEGMDATAFPHSAPFAQGKRPSMVGNLRRPGQELCHGGSAPLGLSLS